MKRLLASHAIKAEGAESFPRTFLTQADVPSSETTSKLSKLALSFVNLSGLGIHFSQVAGVQLVNVEDVVLDSLSITNHGG